MARLRRPMALEGGMLNEAVLAMFAFTERREVMAAAQLRRMLSPLSKNPAVRRALRFQQAMDKALEGELNSALTLYLELAQEGGSNEADAMLPRAPIQAAIAILKEQGAMVEAAELQSLQPRATP